MTDWLAGLRREHVTGTLSDADANPDPFEQFRAWLGEAHAAGMLQANAMTLSTVDVDGRPDGRVVLLKGFDERGFVFYTHRTSRKGDQLASNPHAALTFFWDVLERQVRISGHVERVSAAESAAYFVTRPRGSQVGAWASAQSSVIVSREALEAKYVELDAQYAGKDVTLPPHWGGFRLVPDAFEFWQGRESRLHDRLRYRPAGQPVGWAIERLSP